MKYNRYTPDAPPVSQIGMGTWQLGVNSGWRTLSEEEVITMVHTALDAGVNFFDTAPNYGAGTSELRLGKALKKADRSKIIINTKFGHTVGGNIDFSTDAIRTSVEGSLRRLQVDYLDSAIFHNPPRELLDGNRSAAHYELLEQLKADGKIKAYGASLDTYEEMELFMDTTNGGVIEAFFNILHQDTGRAFGQALEEDVGIIVKIPLDSGWLSGKYGPERTFEGIRSRWSGADIEQRAALVEEVKRLLAPDFQLPQAALAFCMAQEAVSTVIPGTTNLSQLRSNLGSLEKPLPEELVGKLKAFYQEKVRPLRLPW